MSSFIYYLFGWDTEEVKDPLKDKQKHQKYLSCKAIEKGVTLKKTSLLTNLLKQKKQESERKIYAKTYADVKRKTWGRPSKIISGSNFDSIL
jgi:uncharacterized protein YjgD (DUF1641 family)